MKSKDRPRPWSEDEARRLVLGVIPAKSFNPKQTAGEFWREHAAELNCLFSRRLKPASWERTYNRIKERLAADDDSVCFNVDHTKLPVSSCTKYEFEQLTPHQIIAKVDAMTAAMKPLAEELKLLREQLCWKARLVG